MFKMMATATKSPTSRPVENDYCPAAAILSRMEVSQQISPFSCSPLVPSARLPVCQKSSSPCYLR